MPVREKMCRVMATTMIHQAKLYGRPLRQNECNRSVPRKVELFPCAMAS
jgi:hypothetical protein